MNKSLKKSILIFGLAAFVLGGFFAFIPKNDKLFAIAKNIDIFATIVRELDSYYVDEIDPDELVTIGINAMLQELDPYTDYIPEENSDDFRLMTTGEYAGIGALIGNRGEGSMIIMPYTGFPAQTSGLKIADYLLKIDSTDVTTAGTADVSALLKGPPNTPVKILVKRDQDTLQFNIVRKKIAIKNVPYYGKLNDNTGYIKLAEFTTNAANEVRSALVDLKSQGVDRLILDVRDNPGGLVKEAVDIVNLFIPKGKDVVNTIGKLENVNYTYTTSKTPVDKDIPLVVLINERSASASEIVAGSLQDYDRAVLIGRRSFGKGLVQTTVPLSYNAQMKVTTAKYYIPSGRCIQAIDYLQSRESGKITTVPDSLRKEFKTKNGRTVLDGAGIEPDELMDEKSYSPISYSLVARNLVFDFATEYFYKHKEIADPTSFDISEQDYTDFLAFLEGKDYDYTTYLEKSVDDLKANAEKVEYYAEIKDQIAALEKRVNHSKEQDLVTNKEEIKMILSNEIVSRYYFQEGMIQSGLREDRDVIKAKDLLSEPKKVAMVLSASNK